MTETTLGRRIAQRRRMLSLSQEALGDKMEVSRQAISKWEADAAVPEVDRLVQMSKLFGVSVGWLLGTEPDRVTEAAAPDLSDTIAQALRPATPEPEPPASPTPPPAPPSVPITPPRHWLLPVCAAVTAGSLILSAISLTVALTPSKIPTPTTDTTLSDELDAICDRVMALEADLDRAHTRLNDLWDDNMELSLRIHDLEQSGTTAPSPVQPTDPGEEAPTEPSAPQIDPHIRDWSLTSQPDLSEEDAILTFQCAATDLTQVALLARDDEGHVHTVVCDSQEGSFSGELRVPLRNGYTYYSKLTLPDGTEQTVTLTGHGLEDLYSGYIQPQLQFQLSQTIFGNHTQERFWAGYDTILLTPPPLTPADEAPVWQVLTIDYLHNGMWVTGHPLEDLLTDEQRRTPSLNFSLPTQTFDLPALQEGDTHELRLLVEMTFCDTQFTTHLDLNTWIVEDGKLVLQ